MKWLCVVTCILCLSYAAASPTDPESLAKGLYKRLAGVPLHSFNPNFTSLIKLVSEERYLEAAQLITSDPYFYSVTLRNFSAAMSNREGSPYEPLNDFQTLFIGVVRDDLDARTLLTGNFRYEGSPSLKLPPASEKNNRHFEEMDRLRVNLKDSLVRVEPQWPFTSDAAGLLTTRAWAKAHLSAGTNRRSVEYTFQEFLCTPIETWKDYGLPDHRVRRDVDRAPGKEPAVYQQKCRSCHAAMDGLTGAFARFDYEYDTLKYVGPSLVARKMNQNGYVYPEGYFTTSDSWINLANQNHNESFGWHGPQSGTGVRQFGEMIANSVAFSHCLITKVFVQICNRKPGVEDTELLKQLQDKFTGGGYRLKSLFEEIAILPQCTGGNG